MNYVKIGEKIRNYRKAKGLSQDQLAERVDISTTHLSHIETGNTKLSLPVFVAIAAALEVQTDDLLTDATTGRHIAMDDLISTLDTCTTKQLRMITDIVKNTKQIFDKYEV